jgi:hypothetical protein
MAPPTGAVSAIASAAQATVSSWHPTEGHALAHHRLERAGQQKDGDDEAEIHLAVRPQACGDDAGRDERHWGGGTGYEHGRAAKERGKYAECDGTVESGFRAKTGENGESEAERQSGDASGNATEQVAPARNKSEFHDEPSGSNLLCVRFSGPACKAAPICAHRAATGRPRSSGRRRSCRP